MTDLIARAAARMAVEDPRPWWPECGLCGVRYAWNMPTGSSNAVAWDFPSWLHPPNGCAAEAHCIWEHGESND